VPLHFKSSALPLPAGVGFPSAPRPPSALREMDAGLVSEASSMLPAAVDGGSSSQSLLKRKRSPSSRDGTPVAAKSAKNSSNHLTINYLARQYADDLPLISNDDPLPAILSLLNEYQAVLDRHESMACNLGARPIGPILMSRFDRLFDGPPTILKSHNGAKSSETATESQPKVTWLDVVEFARTKTQQFQLSAMSEGKRVCQFYTKQCRVQISEEDFLLIQSGMPQKLIPPQPIIEDEEKELGTLEILEKVLGSVREVADQGLWYFDRQAALVADYPQWRHARDNSTIALKHASRPFSTVERLILAFRIPQQARLMLRW